MTQNTLLAWPDLKKKLPLLAAALPFVGHFQTRNKGTVCGSIAHADPSSEIPLSLAMLEGEVVLRGKRGERVLEGQGFPARHADHRARGRRVDRGGAVSGSCGKGVAFREVARRHGDFAMVAVAALIEDKGSVRLGVGGMAGNAGRAAHRARAASRTRSKSSPASSKATRTCTPRRSCGATSCATSRRVVIAEAQQCAA